MELRRRDLRFLLALTFVLCLRVKSPQHGFSFIKNCGTELGWAVLRLFPNVNWAHDATVRSSIGTPEVVRHDVKHTEIIYYIATGESLYSC